MKTIEFTDEEIIILKQLLVNEHMKLNTGYKFFNKEKVEKIESLYRKITK